MNTARNLLEHELLGLRSELLDEVYLTLGRLLGYPHPTGRIVLTMQAPDTQDIIITASSGLDAKNAPATLAPPLTATVDDTAHFSVSPDASGPNVFRATRLPDAAGDAAGVLNPKITVTDANGLTGVYTFESDPSAATSISLTGVAVPQGAPAPTADASATDAASVGGNAGAAQPGT